MRILFTRQSLRELVLLAAFFMSIGAVYGQSQIVISEGSAAGTYEAIHALWGANNGDVNISGELVLAEDGQANPSNAGSPGSVNDACEMVMNDVSGKIAVIDRVFTCNSREAYDNLSGAIAVMVCANSIDPNYEALSYPLGADTMNTDVIVFGASLEACQNIKMALGAGETVEAEYTQTCEPIVPDNTVWGANGEGTFSEEGNGWEVSGDGFQYRADAYTARGAFNSSLGWARTTTSCNGAYVFDSDFLDNGGVASGAFGTGDCPADCISALTSPVIDLSASPTNAFVLQFDQAFRQFQSDFSVMYSGDGGMTWDTTALNTEAPVNSAHISNTQRISLLGIDSTADLVVRFSMVGNYYYWAIDDVYIIGEESVDVRGNENFAATAPNFRTPQGCGDQHAFLLDIQNYGNTQGDSVSLTVQVESEDGTVLYTDSKDYGSIAPGELAENDFFQDTYDGLAELDQGTYTTRYIVNSPQNTTDPAQEVVRNWEITADQFSRVDLATANLGFFTFTTLESARNFAFGNYYYTNREISPLATSFGLRVSDENEGFIAILDVGVYIWDDLNEDGDCQADERTLVASAEETLENGFTTNAELENFTVVFDEADIIPAGSNVIVMYNIGVEFSDNDEFEVSFLGMRPAGNSDYTASLFATDTLGFPRYGTFVGTGESAIDERLIQPYRSSGGIALYMPLTVLVDPNSTSEEINDAVVSRIFPNPATDFLNVDLNLSQVSEQVEISLVDLTGKVAATQRYNNLQSETVQMNINGLTSGSYIVKIRTDEGITTRKVLILE